MAQQQQKIKGNPAHKRMVNPKNIALRAECWRRGQEKKARRREQQEAAEKRNQKLRSEGKLTPWEEAKKRRYDLRNV